MSLKTWKEEFYPKDADSKFTEIEAIEHSLKKWIGLRKENRDKHKCYLKSFDYCRMITDKTDNYLKIDGGSCSLCVGYIKDNMGWRNCSNCPLYNYLGGHGCGWAGQPFYRFQRTQNPKPMIKALTGCLEKAKIKGKIYDCEH